MEDISPHATIFVDAPIMNACMVITRWYAHDGIHVIGSSAISVMMLALLPDASSLEIRSHTCSPNPRETKAGTPVLSPGILTTMNSLCSPGSPALLTLLHVLPLRLMPVSFAAWEHSEVPRQLMKPGPRVEDGCRMLMPTRTISAIPTCPGHVGV